MTELDVVRRQGGGQKASDRYDVLRHLVTAVAFSCSQSIARVSSLGALVVKGVVRGSCAASGELASLLRAHRFCRCA